MPFVPFAARFPFTKSKGEQFNPQAGDWMWWLEKAFTTRKDKPAWHALLQRGLGAAQSDSGRFWCAAERWRWRPALVHKSGTNSRREAQEDINLEFLRYNGGSRSQTEANGLTSCPGIIRVLNV